ncbi:MAG: DUF58 domain-containing protein [Nocardioidaceae bacterium]
MRSALSILTTRGRAFLTAGITCLLCALLLGQKDLLRVGLLLVALPLITAIVTNRARYLLSCARELTPARVPAGQTSTVTLHLENPGRVPTGLMLLEDQVPYVLGSRPRFVLDQMRPKWKREMAYTVRSDVRGRYGIGPLTVRISDPFGFVELNRSFSAKTNLVVTPTIENLPVTRLSGDWSGTGDNRPRAFASAGTEDVTVREYRTGDDLRRIHWRATAHADELMVRREEQPHQSRATLLLDTRGVAHRGSGPASSLEYAVSMAASVVSHLSGQGFVVRMLTDDLSAADSAWHDRGISAPAEMELLLDTLAVVRSSVRRSFGSGSAEQGSTGLVIAILGSVSAIDVASLSALRAGSTRALAVLLDVESWSKGGGTVVAGSSAQSQVTLLQKSGWATVLARPGDRIPAVWRDLANTRPMHRDFTAEVRAANVNLDPVEDGPAA